MTKEKYKEQFVYLRRLMPELDLNLVAFFAYYLPTQKQLDTYAKLKQVNHRIGYVWRLFTSKLSKIDTVSITLRQRYFYFRENNNVNKEFTALLLTICNDDIKYKLERKYKLKEIMLIE